MTWTVKGKVLFGTLLVLGINTLLSALLAQSLPPLLAYSLALLVSVVGLVAVLQYLFGTVRQMLSALEVGVASFRDSDFSITLHVQREDEFSTLVHTFNDMAATLRAERMALFQRELLLDTIMQVSPVAVLLVDSRDFIIYANSSAANLFNSEKKLEGCRFQQWIAALPPELAEATQARRDGLVALTRDNSRATYYVHTQEFVLNALPHRLYIYKNLSTEMSRKEIDLWKNAIRLISHELNNSLAPISSLANSAKKMLQPSADKEDLYEIIDIISQRSARLKDFLSRYAEFARLPAPRMQTTALKPFIQRLQTLCEFQLLSTIPDISLNMDAGQIEQVLINLFRNAAQSGAPITSIGLQVTLNQRQLEMCVMDEGPGMTEQQLQQALLPFYSTRAQGTGLGLSLCNEIVQAHNGSIQLLNRPSGGLAVKLLFAFEG